MTSQRHVIKKQILDLHISSELKAFELQNEISALYRRKIVPLIESYCDRLSEPDRIYRIDLLELDIGTIAIENLPSDFVEKVANALAEKLSEELASLPGKKSTPIAQNTEISSNHLEKDTYNVSPKPINLAEANLELFRNFIQTGLLPWWSEPLSKQALEDCCQQLLLTSPEVLKALLTDQLKQAKILQRLIYQFSDPILIDIVILLAPAWSQWVRPYIQDLQTLVPQIESWRGIAPGHFRLTFWQGIFSQLLLSSTPSPSSDAAIQSSLHHLATSFQTDVRSLFPQIRQAIKQLRAEGVRFDSQLPKFLATHSERGIRKTVNKSLSSDRLRGEVETLSRFLNELINLDDQSSSNLRLRGEVETLNPKINLLLRQLTMQLRDPSADRSLILSTNALLIEIEALVAQLERYEVPTIYDQLSNSINAITKSLKSQPRSPEPTICPELFNYSNDPFSDSEEIYIQNAGLVLLWPFLNRFFAGLNLLQDSHFIDLQTAKRAVLLLQYLADASSEIPEHLLPLNKLLCGLDLSESIETNLDITEQEQRECDNLLLAVIQNWSALKSTSTKGFQQAFIQRASILKIHNGNWLLQVEQETYDILLDQLPWSISVVKLPWMDELLYVDW